MNKSPAQIKIALISLGFLASLRKFFYLLRKAVWGLQFQRLTFVLFTMSSLSCLFLCGCASTATHRPVILRLSAWGSTEETHLLRRQLARFEASHPGLKVELLHAPENYFQKLHLLIAAGEAPDVLMLNSLSYALFAQAGVLQDLNPLLKEEANGSLGQATFFPQALQAFQWKTPKQSQPMQAALPRDVSNLVVYYNKTLLKKAGLPEPSSHWDWDEALKLAKQVTYPNAEPSVYGFSFYGKPPLFWLPFVWSWGGELLPGWYCGAGNGKPVSKKGASRALTYQQGLLGEASLTGLRFYQALRYKYQVAPTPEAVGATPMTQLFLQQRLAFLISGRWTTPFLREQASFDWDVIPFPKGPAGSRVGVDATGYGISSATRHPQEAKALVQFLLAKPQIETVTASGLIIPARRDVAQSSVFLNPDKLPGHSQVFLDAIATGVPSVALPNWNELETQLGTALEPAWYGKAEPEKALLQRKSELKKLMQSQSFIK